MFHDTIRIGTLVNGGATTADYLRQILPHGFESFSITFWQTVGEADLGKLADEVQAVLAGSDAVISSLSVFGNPLLDDEAAARTRASWAKLIDAAHLFGCDIVTGFTGRMIDTPIDQCIPRYTEVFTPLAERAAGAGVRLAFENCDMGGTWNTGGWNIAHTPAAWELMFAAIPLDNIGLQWEPCHQLVKLIDPMPQLRQWVTKIFHVHGKDATVYGDVVRRHGVFGPHPF
ncbi:MAG TPA: sugar phosphate isomerase/epimerase family protein, partial [Armatimonadota bacterium]|nr:sugar phosphate isomerase/epimerase family protein [Armatimonadota bacterium]